MMNFGLRSVTSIIQGAASTIKRYIRSESESVKPGSQESQDSDEESESVSDAKRIKLDLVQDAVSNEDCVHLPVIDDDKGSGEEDGDEASMLSKDAVQQFTQVIEQSCAQDKDFICDKGRDAKCDEGKIFNGEDVKCSNFDDAKDSIDTENGGSVCDNDVQNMATEVRRDSPEAAGPNDTELSDSEESEASTASSSDDSGGIYDADSDSVRCTLNQTCEILNEVGLTFTEDLEGRELDAVWTVCQHSSGLVWLVKFKDNDPLEMVPGKLMNQYFPLTVIRFYERRLNFPSKKKSQKEKKTLSSI